jgi:O-antigen biosynthesis protein WbqP
MRLAVLIRMFDILFAFLGLGFGFPILLAITILSSVNTKSPFFFQKRVGRWGAEFTLIKFRTMQPGTKDVATHLVSPAAVTPFGRFLRGTKIDELPQLWNVLKGDMSLVGPRPGLPNQVELIDAREALGVFDVRPGITGLAQVSGIDMSTPEFLAQTDARMIAEMSVYNYFKYIGLTIAGRGSGDRVR